MTDHEPDWAEVIKQMHPLPEADAAVREQELPRFRRDWAGPQFLSSLLPDASVAPRFYGGDTALRLIAVEDIGRHATSLVDSRLGQNPEQARDDLLLLAEALARMHVAGAGQRTAYDAILQQIDPAAAMDAAYIKTHNDPQNGPMLAINRKLGYVPGVGEYRLSKRL